MYLFNTFITVVQPESLKTGNKNKYDTTPEDTESYTEFKARTGQLGGGKTAQGKRPHSPRAGFLAGDPLCTGFLQMLVEGGGAFPELTACVFKGLSMLSSPSRLWIGRVG